MKYENEGEEVLSSAVGRRCRLDTGEMTLQVANKHKGFCNDRSLKSKLNINNDKDDVVHDNASIGYTSQSITDSDEEENGRDFIGRKGERREAHEDEMDDRILVANVGKEEEYDVDDCANSTISSISECSNRQRGHRDSSLKKNSLLMGEKQNQHKKLENIERDISEMQKIGKNSHLPTEITLSVDSNSHGEWHEQDELAIAGKKDASTSLPHSSLIPLAVESDIPANDLPSDFPIPTIKQPVRTFFGKFRTFSADSASNILNPFSNVDHVVKQKNEESADYTHINDDGDCLSPMVQIVSDTNKPKQFGDADDIMLQRNDDGDCITDPRIAEEKLAKEAIEDLSIVQNIEEVNGEYSVYTKQPINSFFGKIRTFSADATNNILKQFDNTAQNRHQKNGEIGDYVQRNYDGDCLTCPLSVITDVSIQKQIDGVDYVERRRDGDFITQPQLVEDSLLKHVESPKGQKIKDANGKYSATVGKRPRRIHRRTESTESVISIGILVGQSSMSPSAPLGASSTPCDNEEKGDANVDGVDHQDTKNEDDAKITEDFLSGDKKKKSGFRKDMEYYWTRIKGILSCCFKKEKLQLRRCSGCLT